MVKCGTCENTVSYLTSSLVHNKGVCETCADDEFTNHQARFSGNHVHEGLCRPETVLLVGPNYGLFRVYLEYMISCGFENDKITVLITRSFSSYDLARLHDVVIIDVDNNLGDLQGVLQKMKNACGEEKETKIIAMSKYVDAALRDACLRGGADAYIVKPFTLEGFKQKITKVLNKISAA